jgi:hypothetical protein
MSVDYKIDYSEFERLSESIKMLGDKSEKTMNNSLEKNAEKIIVPKITNLIPVSSWKNSRLANKVHAKQTKWHKVEKGNLEVTIKSKGGAANKRGSFGYLVFPNEGRGSSNPVEQQFMEKGLEQGTPELVDHIQDDLLKVLEEEL